MLVNMILYISAYHIYKGTPVKICMVCNNSKLFTLSVKYEHISHYLAKATPFNRYVLKFRLTQFAATIETAICGHYQLKIT